MRLNRGGGGAAAAMAHTAAAYVCCPSACTQAGPIGLLASQGTSVRLAGSSASRPPRRPPSVVRSACKCPPHGYGECACAGRGAPYACSALGPCKPAMLCMHASACTRTRRHAAHGPSVRRRCLSLPEQPSTCVSCAVARAGRFEGAGADGCAAEADPALQKRSCSGGSGRQKAAGPVTSSGPIYQRRRLAQQWHGWQRGRQQHGASAPAPCRAGLCGGGCCRHTAPSCSGFSPAARS